MLFDLMMLATTVRHAVVNFFWCRHKGHAWRDYRYPIAFEPDDPIVIVGEQCRHCWWANVGISS